MEFGILLLLVAINAVLAASEIAVVTARKVRLRMRAEEGDAAAAAALALANEPGRFLSTVQIGITAIAVVAGAFGGTRVAGTLAEPLAGAGVPPSLAPEVALVLVVGLVTFLTVVLGELVPKRLALQDPEKVASRVAGGMRLLATAAGPLVRILEGASDLVLRLVGRHHRDEPDVTEEEIRGMIAHATETGVLEATEQQITERLFRLSDTWIGALMTPRDDIVWLDRGQGPEEWKTGLGKVEHTRYLVADGDVNQTAGYVKVQDLLAQLLSGDDLRLDSHLRTPHSLPQFTPAFRLLELFQWSGDHMALVMGDRDEVLGLVTLNDVLEGIVGDLPTAEEVAPPEVLERTDGSWLLDGLLPMDRFLATFQEDAPELSRFPTVHSFVVEQLEGQPHSTAAFRWRGFRVEVVDMDGSRVDKVWVTRVSGDTPPDDSERTDG